MNIVTDQTTQLCCQSLFLFLDTILFRVSIRNSSHQHIEVLSKTVPKPVLPKDSKDSVLVRVHAVGLNPVDAKQVSGDKLPQGYMRKFFHKAVVRDTVIGFDFLGVVEESNNGCEYKAGDQVFGTVPPLYGSLQEYIVVPTHHIYRKPSSLTTVEAAALPLVGLTAYQALRPHARESTHHCGVGRQFWHGTHGAASGRTTGIHHSHCCVQWQEHVLRSNSTAGRHTALTTPTPTSLTGPSRFYETT